MCPYSGTIRGWSSTAKRSIFSYPIMLFWFWYHWVSGLYSNSSFGFWGNLCTCIMEWNIISKSMFNILIIFSNSTGVCIRSVVNHSFVRLLFILFSINCRLIFPLFFFWVKLHRQCYREMLQRCVNLGIRKWFEFFVLVGGTELAGKKKKMLKSPIKQIELILIKLGRSSKWFFYLVFNILNSK